MPFEIRQLRHAVAAADYKSFHQAAIAMEIEQSTLSRSVAKLERVVGVQLLTRSRAGVKVTPAGAEFIRAARPMIAMADRMIEEARVAQHVHNKRLAIGHNSSISAGHLRALLDHFRLLRPDVEISPVEAPREVLLAGIDAGIVDMSVISGEADRSRFRSEKLWNERLMAAVPTTHPLARQELVTWADLGTASIVLTAIDPGPGIGEIVRHKLSGNNGQPAIKMLNTSRESMLSMLSGGQDISIHCACATGASYPGVIYREVHDNDGQSWVRYSAYWRSGNDNPALRRFLGTMRERHSLSFDLP